MFPVLSLLLCFPKWRRFALLIATFLSIGIFSNKRSVYSDETAKHTCEFWHYRNKFLLCLSGKYVVFAITESALVYLMAGLDVVTVCVFYSICILGNFWEVSVVLKKNPSSKLECC